MLELNFVFLSEIVSHFGQVNRCLPSFVSCNFGLDLGWLRSFSPLGGRLVSPRGGFVLGLGIWVVDDHGFPEDSLVILGQGNVSWRITRRASRRVSRSNTWRVSRRVSVSPRGGNLVSPQGGDVLGVVLGVVVDLG